MKRRFIRRSTTAWRCNRCGYLNPWYAKQCMECGHHRP